MRVILTHLVIFAIFALINVVPGNSTHDTQGEAPSKEPRSLQKFVSKSSPNVTENRQPPQSTQTPLTTSADSHASKKVESLDKGMESASTSFAPLLPQVDSKAPSLLLLKHFRKQVPSPALRVPKPTVISSQETGGGNDAKTRLPARFVGPSALITKSSSGNVHNDTDSTIHSLHDLFSLVTPAGIALSSLANGGSGALTQSMAETGYIPNGYSTVLNRVNGDSTTSSLGQSSPVPVDTINVLHGAKDTMYPTSAYGFSFHTTNGASTSAPFALSSPQSATKLGLITNRYGNPIHRGTELSTLPPPKQGFSGPPRKVSTTPQSPTVANHAGSNGFQNFFRRKQGESIVSNNLLVNPPTTMGPLIKTKNKFSSVYSEEDFQKPQTAHPTSNAHKVGVGTAGLTGVLVPGAQDKHLLKLLELISKANTGDRSHNYTRNTTPATVTQAPATVTSTFAYPLGKVSTSSGLKQDIGTSGYTTPSYLTRDMFKSTVAPNKNRKNGQRQTVAPRTHAVHPVTSPSNFLLHHGDFTQRSTITPRMPVMHASTSPSSMLLHQSIPSQRPAITPRTPAMHTPTIPSGLILPQNNLQWLSTMGHLKDQRILNNLVPIESSGSLLSLLPTRLGHPQPIVEVNRMGTVDSSDEEENLSIGENTQKKQSTEETISLSGNQQNAANSSKLTASSDSGEDLGSLLHLVTAAPVEQGNVLIDMFEQVFSEDEVKNNPVVKNLHDKLENKIQDLKLGAAGDPTFSFLIYFLVPFAIIAVLTFTLMGVAPEYVGLTGLLIPLLILATLTNGSRKSRGRNARATRSNNDILLNEAHLSLLKTLESFEKSYMGS